MSELTLQIIKLGFLAVLWLFVLSAVSVIRADLFGSGRSAGRAAQREHKSQQVKSPRASRRNRGEPSVAVVVRGANTGFQAPLGDAPVVIGRGTDCQIPVDDEYVSTRHAVLRKHGHTWYAEDLGSTNGTFVGESRIQGPTAIGPGGSVRVGKTVIELRK